MTDPAAVAGNFSDFKTVKTRSIVQLIVEIPIEIADRALFVLGGVPQPGEERPVAVALLNPKMVEAAKTLQRLEAKREAREDGEPDRPQDRTVVRAVMLCKEPRFQQWIMGADNYLRFTSDDEREHGAALMVRARCKVSSRSELANDIDAQTRFRHMENEYMTAIGERPRM